MSFTNGRSTRNDSHSRSRSVHTYKASSPSASSEDVHMAVAMLMAGWIRSNSFVRSTSTSPQEQSSPERASERCASHTLTYGDFGKDHSAFMSLHS